jgi:type II secretory pathway component GspD/PulD (secretin)
LLLLSCLGLSAGGQQPGGLSTSTSTGAPQVKRVVYDVKHGIARDLAELLVKVYKTEPRVQVLAAPAGNALVIGAPSETLDELLQLLKQLDRRPRSVAIEIVVIDVPPRKGEKGKPAPPVQDLDTRDLNGNADDALAKLRNLQARGVIGGLKRFRLTAAENQTAALLLGENRPSTMGVAGGLRGKTARSILYRNIGTSIRATPRLGEGNKIVLQLHLDDARLRTPEDGIALGMGDNAEPVRATEILMDTVDGQVTLTSGEAVVMSGVRTLSQSGQRQTLVLVSARLLEPEARDGK